MAVEQAARLAKEWDAALTVAHVFNDSAWASIKAIYDLSSWAASARQKLAALDLAARNSRWATRRRTRVKCAKKDNTHEYPQHE